MMDMTFPVGTSVLEVVQSLDLDVWMEYPPEPTERQKVLERLRHMLIATEVEKHDAAGCC